MKLKNLIWAFIIIGAAGSLGHFLYKWSGENTILGYFFPVNESTWEHLKLLFFPTIIFSVFEYFLMREKPTNYLPSIAVSLIMGLLSIVIIFYTYSGVLGFKVEWFNIAIYYTALLIMLIVKTALLLLKFESKTANWLSLLWIFVMALMFIFFTYNPLDLGIFKVP
ncbi:MAG: hypothetical protein J6B80_03335 [Clostridia bacterium]|nr:hypothetical protein [Clostridia bacterium]